VASIRPLNRLESVVSNSASYADSWVCVGVARSARDSPSRLSPGKPWVSESNVTNSALEPSRLCIKFSVRSGWQLTVLAWNPWPSGMLVLVEDRGPDHPRMPG